MVVYKLNWCTEIHQVVWFCFMLRLITCKLKTVLFYFNKTYSWSVIFMRLKTFQNRAFLNTRTRTPEPEPGVKISNYSISPLLSQNSAGLLGFNWVHFHWVYSGSFVFTSGSLGFTLVHSGSLDITQVHLSSLWVHLSLLEFTRVHLGSLGCTRVHWGALRSTQK